MTHRIARFFLTLALSLLFIAPFRGVMAQDNYVDNDYAAGIEAAIMNNEANSPGYVSHVTTNSLADIIRRIIGPVPGVTVTADAWERNPELVRRMAQGSAINQVGTIIAQIYATPPTDTVAFFRDMGESLGFVPKSANAQGIGFSGLSPLLPIWKVFRNISYILLSFVFVIIGFMVMLRKKIDPKTVVTIQNALPKVFVTLIMITFSYAIVGIMIDLMYLTILLSANLLQSTGLLGDPNWYDQLISGFSTPADVMTGGGLFSVFRLLFPWNILSLSDLAADIMGYSLVSGVASGALVGGLVGLINPAWGVGVGAATLASPVLLSALIALGLLFLFIRLLLLFLGAYVQIILSLLFAPIQLLGEAIPGSTAFEGWFKNLVANIAVFPIAATLFMLASVFSNLADASNGRIWAPPFAIMPGAQARSVSALFALGLLMSIPTIANSVKQLLKAKTPLGAGPGAMLTPFGTAFGTATTSASLFYYGQNIMKGFRKEKHQ